MSGPDFITTPRVAAMMGVSTQHLLRKRDELIEDHGFPPPVGFALCPLRWRADQVRDWLDRQGRPQPPAQPKAGAFRPYLIAKAARP